jgi:replication factor C subunit 3/5
MPENDLRISSSCAFSAEFGDTMHSAAFLRNSATAPQITPLRGDESKISIDLRSSGFSSNSTVPWIEKYRPKQFDDIVLDPLNRTFFKNIVEKKHFPNLLFYGPPGTGKTTTIINLINEYQMKHTRVNKESVIHLNASDERGIDIIRTQIHQFVRSRHIFESGCKFVILDEVDYMTKNAQQALKTLLQTSRTNVRFCLICNYISKIDDSLQQEFVSVRFNQLPWTEIKTFLRKIADAEGVALNDDDAEVLRDTHQSDIRSMINFMQSSQNDQCVSSSLSGKQRESGFSSTSGSYSIKSLGSQMISVKEWNHLHELMRERGQDAIIYIGILSETRKISKKQIVLNYANYVIRNFSHAIDETHLAIFEKIAHASDDMNIGDIVRYFVLNFELSSNAASSP